MTIPKELMLSVKSALELLNSSKLKKQYELYLKEDQESAKKKQTIFDEAHIDQSFLSYLLYVITKRKNIPKQIFINIMNIYLICSKII